LYYNTFSKYLPHISNKHLNIVLSILTKRFKMVNEKVNVRDKKRGLKKFLKIFVIIFISGIVIFAFYYTIGGIFFGKGGQKIVLENPLKDIVLKYAEAGVLSEEQTQQVIEEAVLEFNGDYINYLLVALGIHNLHSALGFGNPKIEMDLGGEIWGSEIIKGVQNTDRSAIEGEDIKIRLSKEEAVKAILSSDVEQFMKDSVGSGNTQIELVAGKVELFGKGYLNLYKELTGDELEV